MANRFPLIVDSSGTAAIKELASGDNLDLTGNGIVGAGTVALTNLTVGGSQGTDGQVLTSTGSGIAWEDAASGGGGGGMWTQIATTTISSETFSVEFTNLGSYDEYELRFTGVGTGTAQGWQTLAVNFDYGSGYVSSGYRYKHFYHSSSSSSGSLDAQGSTNEGNLPVTAYKFGYNSGTVRTPAFGLVGWTSAGAMFWAKGYSNRESNDYGLKYQQLIASHSSYELTAPTKIKLLIVASGNAPTTTSGEGMRSGKFTLYGRVAS